MCEGRWCVGVCVGGGGVVGGGVVVVCGVCSRVWSCVVVCVLTRSLSITLNKCT